MPALSHFIGAWSAATALPVARRLFASCAIGGKILVAGGYPTSTTCYLYDPATGAWTTTGVLPAAVYNTGACASPLAAFVIGGFSGVARADCYKYDPVVTTWTTDTSLPIATYGHTVTYISNKNSILITGGLAPTIRTANCYRADTLATPLVWTAATPLPVATYSHSAVELADGRLLVSGGFTNTVTANCYLLDTAGSTWTVAAPMPVPRRVHQSTLLSDGRVFVSGGSNAAGDLYADCCIYDPATNTWITTAPLPAALTQHGQVLIDNRLMIIGGYIGTAVQSACYTRPDQQVLFTHKPRPDQMELAWLQDTDKTTAGLPVTQLPYAKTRTSPFSWNNMPRTDKDRLLSFFDAMGGMATQFNAVNHDGTYSTGRFGQPELTFTERYTDVFSTTVPFMEITP